MFLPMTALIYSPLLLLLAFDVGYRFAKYGTVRPTVKEKIQTSYVQNLGEVYALLMSPVDQREPKIEQLWKRCQTKDNNNLDFDVLGDTFLIVWSAHVMGKGDEIPTPLSGYTHNFDYLANMYRCKIDNAIAKSPTAEGLATAVKLRIKLDELCELVQSIDDVRIEGGLEVFKKRCLAYCNAMDTVKKDLQRLLVAFRPVNLGGPIVYD